ncbi:MAG: hypothetical protein R3244_10555, partial [Thermoanaerobaculia bacterium]|nr:hypothetical protein [Thermoanaerobaculia bacterium]
MLSRPVKILVGLLVAGGAVVYWLTWRSADEPVTVPADVVPPGRWNRAPAAAPTDDDLAAVLSLPYLEGRIEAADRAGVLVHDPERASDGLNLYSSGHAPEAVLMDMRGRVLHRWRMPFAEAFPELSPNQESHFFRRVALLPHGELLALFQGKGLIKLDRHSRLVWARPMPAFNDLWVEPDGGLLVL